MLDFVLFSENGILSLHCFFFCTFLILLRLTSLFYSCMNRILNDINKVYKDTKQVMIKHGTSSHFECVMKWFLFPIMMIMRFPLFLACELNEDFEEQPRTSFAHSTRPISGYYPSSYCVSDHHWRNSRWMDVINGSYHPYLGCFCAPIVRASQRDRRMTAPLLLWKCHLLVTSQ